MHIFLLIILIMKQQAETQTRNNSQLLAYEIYPTVKTSVNNLSTNKSIYLKKTNKQDNIPTGKSAKTT